MQADLIPRLSPVSVDPGSSAPPQTLHQPMMAKADLKGTAWANSDNQPFRGLTFFGCLPLQPCG
jgi:hypothetical protein